jgi:hypothetical protein
VSGASLVPVPRPSPTRPQFGVAERTGALDLEVTPPVTDHPRRLRSHVHTLGLRSSSDPHARHVLRFRIDPGIGSTTQADRTGFRERATTGSAAALYATQSRRATKRLWNPNA